MPIMDSICLLFICSLLLTVKGCPSGWTQDGTQCYYLSQLKATWPEAASYCREFHSKLAEPNEKIKINFLAGIMQSRPSSSGEYFLGGSDIIQENEWLWSSSMTLIETTNWGPGEPTNSGNHEDCLAITNAGKWNDVPCDIKLTFICERETSDDPDVIG